MAVRMKADELEALDGVNIRSRIRAQRADSDYLIDHYRELLSKYRNQWVIISGGRLVKSERDPERLLDTLSKTRRKGMLVHYLADPEEVMLL